MRENNSKIPEHYGRLIGRNAVSEALKNGREINKLLVAKGTEGSVKKLEAMAGERGIPISYCDKKLMDKMFEDGKHQGVIAYAAAYKYAKVDDIIELARCRGEDPFIIILDGIEDPHNVGAILRSAECAGAHGVVVGKHRGAGLTETVAKASAGAVEYIHCARVTNIVNTIVDLKKKGIWIASCDMDGDRYTATDLNGPLAVVIGGEGRGVSALVNKNCDFSVSIPMEGRIKSLNASNAAAIIMYEIRRQRDEGKI